MATERFLDADIVSVALRLFSPGVRAAILKDAALRERVPVGVEAVIKVERTGAEFTRSRFFQAVRQVLTGVSQGMDVEARDGTVWHVTHDGARGIIVANGGVVSSFPEFACMAPDSDARIEWYELQTATCGIGDDRTRRWGEILAERPLEDEELDDVLDEFRLTPIHCIMAIRDRLRNGKFSAADLVPTDLRYFDRLAGEPPAGTKLREFVLGVVRSHVHTLVRWNAYEGLRAALLLSSHQMVSEVVDLTMVPRGEVRRVFEWLMDHGDRISQIGAIECGLRHLDSFPEIEPFLVAMTREVSADDPEAPWGTAQALVGSSGACGRRGHPPRDRAGATAVLEATGVHGPRCTD